MENGEELVLGIDEVGRGPVIGPLVVAGVLMKEKDLAKLENTKVKDSKLLSKKQRESLKETIESLAEKVEIIELSSQEIDAALNSDHLNLNWLEALAQVEIINKLKPNRVIIDCPSNNIRAFSEYVRERLDNKNIIIQAEHKADVNHKIVGAASILAKLRRDEVIEKIKKVYGDCGPGYPANSVTQKFIKENYEKHPEIFRQTWSTYQNHVKKKTQKSINEFK